MRSTILFAAALCLCAAHSILSAAIRKSTGPENLAQHAAITASGALNNSYHPRYVVDQVIPWEGSRNDLAHACCLPHSQAAGAYGFSKLLVVQRQELNPSHVYTYHQENLRPGGGLWVRDFTREPTEMKKILDSEEGVILDAQLHYNGRTILFSWKRTMDDLFQLYTIDITGEHLRPLTRHHSNNFNASWLPDGGIVFLSDRKPAFAYCWKTTTPILWRCNGDGNFIRGPYLHPWPLDDRRYLVSRAGSIQLRDYEGQLAETLLARRGALGFYNPQPVTSRQLEFRVSAKEGPTPTEGT